VAHNTYAELGAEAGLPGVFLFVLLLALSLRKIKKVRKLPGYQTSEDIRLWTSALWAALAAYISGRCSHHRVQSLSLFHGGLHLRGVPDRERSPGCERFRGDKSSEETKFGRAAKRERPLAWTR